MKKSAILLAASGLALGSLHAQLPQTVPLYLNYQGKITSGSGVPIGSAGTAPNFTPAPENRKVIFRIFGSQSGTDRLWSEVQTVTISLGEFSVLLGQGGIATYENIAEARPALDSIFTGPPPPQSPPPPPTARPAGLRSWWIPMPTDRLRQRRIYPSPRASGSPRLLTASGRGSPTA